MLTCPRSGGHVSTYGSHQTYIAAKHTREWALLSNIRYRLLLSYIALSFRLARGGRGGAPDLRGMTMHRVFGEMYNIKTIAGILTELPLDPDEVPGPKMEVAGPPFEMPYALRLPDGDRDAWRVLRDLLDGSVGLAGGLLPAATGAAAGYLQALIELDRQAMAWMDAIIAGRAEG